MDLETLAIRYETLGENEVNASLNRITDSTRQLTLQQMEAIKMNDALAESQETAAVATAGHGFQIGRLRQDLGSLIGRLTGTNLAVDRVGSALGAMAIGNVAIIGVLAGIAGIAFAYDKLTLSLKGVTAEQEKAAEGFEKAQRLKEAGGKIGVEASALQAEVTKAQADLDSLNNRLAYAQANPMARGVELVEPLQEEIRKQSALLKQKKALDDNIALRKKADKIIIDETQKHDLEVLAKQAEALATLIKGNRNTDAQYDQKALADEKSYYLDAKANAVAGNIAIASEYQKLGDILKTAFTKADKPAKPSTKKDLPGLADFLAEQKAEVAALKETHDLQVRLEEDSLDATEQKYAKLRALDEAYLIEVGAIYGFESAEYDAVLKTMEEHRKQHTDVILAEIKRETEEGNKQAEAQSIEDEKMLKKKEANAAKLSGVLSSSMAAAFTEGFKGGGVAGAMEKFADMVLSGLGKLLVQLGEQYIAYGGIMDALSSLLYDPYTAGPAALAIGAALIALGSALGSVGTGGGGGGGGGGPVGSPGTVHFTGATTPTALPGGPNSATTTGNMKATGPVIGNLTLLGPNDPVLQRQLLETIAKANVR